MAGLTAVLGTAAALSLPASATVSTIKSRTVSVTFELSKLASTSFTSPGLSAAASITVLGSAVTAKAAGYPKPSPGLTTTKIS